MTQEACTKVRLCCRKLAAVLSVIEDEAEQRADGDNYDLAASIDNLTADAEKILLNPRSEPDDDD